MNLEAVHLEDSIVEIAPQLERFFGMTGRMLKPSVKTIAAMLAHIPSGQVMTTDSLRRTLADQFGVEVTCPYDTKMALLAISHDPILNASGLNVPFWRVVKANGELIPKFAGGLEVQVALLRAEGFTVNVDGKAKLKAFKDKLFAFN
jgi:alkylated DNA nucleotide flippase Atl1